MKSFLIDPKAQTVTEVEYTGNIETIYTHIEADIFDAVRFNEKGDGVFVDDEGLLKGPKFFFVIDGYPGILAGRGLVLGCDARGESVAPTVTLEWLQQHVGFVECLAPRMFAAVAPSDDMAEKVNAAIHAL